jgi:hypothetical protein
LNTFSATDKRHNSFYAPFGKRVIECFCNAGLFEQSTSFGLLPLKKIVSLQQAYLEQSWGINTLNSKGINEDIDTCSSNNGRHMSFDEVVGEKLLTATINNSKAALNAHNRMF